MAASAATRFVVGMITLLVPLAGACGGDDETPKSLYSEPCTTDVDCAEALECVEAIGICSQGCSTPQQCKTNLGSATAVCVGGICQEPCTPASYNPCGPGTECIDGIGGATCRVK